MICGSSSVAIPCVTGADLVVNTKNLLKYTQPRALGAGTTSLSAAELLQFLDAQCFNRIGEGYRRVLPRPRFLRMKNIPVHVTAADSHHRRAAGLTFQRDQPKSFLDARVDEEIGRAIITREINGVGAILNPGNVFPATAGLQLSKFLTLRPIADDQHMKFVWAAPLQNLEGPKQWWSALFPCQTASVAKQLLIPANTYPGASRLA